MDGYSGFQIYDLVDYRWSYLNWLHGLVSILIHIVGHIVRSGKSIVSHDMKGEH